MLVVASGAVTVVSSLRWLRVAQREHYLAPAVTRFASRWWSSSALNVALAVIGVAGAIGVWINPGAGWLTLLVATVGPVGLGLKGRTSPLVWTSRLRRLAAALAVCSMLLFGVSAVSGEPGWIVAAVLLLPALVDAALIPLTPIERLLAEKWVAQARSRLAASGARVVAVTGSYGKTTTKGYIGHLLAGRFQTALSPASFNNRMGLARAINEQLGPGVDVFVAEMGTYSRGEIAALCDFVPPDISVITAIGPVHLERFGTVNAIVAAKREILDKASVAVVNIDHPLLARVADEEEGTRQVIRVSDRAVDADVSVVDGVLRVGGMEIGVVGSNVFPVNLAAAVAAATALGVSPTDISLRLGDLPAAAHRLQERTSENGVLILDDTYNSNPAGAAIALKALAAVPGGGKRVVVTPGMVELGSSQDRENRDFARAAAAFSSDLLVVGRTNRSVLLEGAWEGAATVTVVDSLTEAVQWVRSHLGAGDAVLYENDLPDHYP